MHTSAVGACSDRRVHWISHLNWRWRFHRVAIGERDHDDALRCGSHIAWCKNNSWFGADMSHYSYGRSPWIANELGVQGNPSNNYLCDQEGSSDITLLC